MNAYFVKCTGYDTDENGNVTAVYAEYDPETKSGSGFDGRKLKARYIGYMQKRQYMLRYVYMKTLLMKQKACTTRRMAQ